MHRHEKASEPNTQAVDTPTSVHPHVSDISSDIHEIQMRYKLSSATMKTLSSISRNPDRRQVLYKACLVSEFRSFPLKQAEGNFFRHINDNTAIPYTIKETVGQPWHKVFLLVQIDLLSANWPNKLSKGARQELYQERGRIFVLLGRILRCLIDIMGERRDGRGVNVGLDVLRSIKSGVWEGSGQELRLVSGIGPAKLEKFGQAGIKRIHQLTELDFCNIERLMSRNPPYGHQLLQQLSGFPKLSCQFEAVGNFSPNAKLSHVVHAAQLAQPLLQICRVVLAYDNGQVPFWKKNNPWVTFVLQGEDGRLVWFWRGSVNKLTDEKELIVGLEVKSGEEIGLMFACEEIVGTTVQSSYQMP